MENKIEWQIKTVFNLSFPFFSSLSTNVEVLKVLTILCNDFSSVQTLVRTWTKLWLEFWDLFRYFLRLQHHQTTFLRRYLILTIFLQTTIQWIVKKEKLNMCLQLKMQTIKFLIKMLIEDYNFENVFFSILTTERAKCTIYNTKEKTQKMKFPLFFYNSCLTI